MGSGFSRDNNVRPETRMSVISGLSSKEVDDDETLHEDEKRLEKHEAYLENMYLLKRMFKQLDPAVMKTTTDVQGDIKVSVKYVSDKSLLLVKVIAAQDLIAKDIRGHTSDPYVKVLLLMHRDATIELTEEQKGMKCTSVAKNTRNPIFNEIFTFPVTSEQINFLQLRCSVWSFDALGKDDFMGERIISVADLSCYDVVASNWYELLPEVDLTIGGNVGIKLNYKLPQTLNVIIEGAKGIRIDNDDVEPFVRVYIPGVPYVYKTWPCKERTGSPEWNESFDFPVPKEELNSRYIVLIVADANETDSYLGECHIDLDNFQFDQGFEGVFPLSDMRGNVAVRSRWTRNAITQEFQEAMVAHAMYKKPNMVFARVRGAGNQAISIRVPKAGAQSRLRVVNGVLVR
uniref:Synaptotagmin-1-like n=1 Tax=Phallusia mammillata TaxID=59560 RepID=A0A6F9DV64_9ASCI|nr:synaptotagmin-1-like [Phallusia mammillata]